ncbi:MFS transporter [Streptodolium elevatio]|uniref:MFS transporter n=1 Tax=Streptodolium elevatio TaxID=3157996 RepID=A0ABV3DJ03_9ACTN
MSDNSEKPTETPGESPGENPVEKPGENPAASSGEPRQETPQEASAEKPDAAAAASGSAAEPPSGPPAKTAVADGPSSGDPASGDDVTGRLEGASKARVFSVLAVIVLFSEVVPLQYSMVSTAVQKVGQDFPTAGDNVSWMIIILGLVGGATTPILGKLADLVGKKLVLMASSIAFLAGSLICALTESWAVFLIGRGLQATAFAMAAIAAGLIRDLMPRKYVPLAIGVIATGFGVSALASPFLTGWLTDHWSWRSIFWFLTIYILVLIPIFWIVVPETKLKVKQNLDWLGSVLVGAGAALALVYLSNGQQWGWGEFTAYIYLIGGVALLVLFYWWELRAPEPIMDPKLLRTPRVSIVLAIGLFSNMIIGVQAYAVAYMAQIDKEVVDNGVVQGFAAQSGVSADALRQVLVFDGDLAYALGFSLMALAVHITAWQAIPGMFTGPAAGEWGKRRGLREPYLWAMILMTATMVMYALWHGTWVQLLLISIVFGIAFGMYYGAANNLIVEAVPQEQQGIGASMLGLTQSFGSAVGTAILTAIVSAHPYQVIAPSQTGGPPTTVDVTQVYTDEGWTLVFWAMAAAGLVSVVLAFVMRAGRTPATGGTLH